MKKNPKHNNQLEITDLIGDAVENAIARREQNLTAEETEQIKGGITLDYNNTSVAKLCCPIVVPIIAGGIMVPPVPPIRSIKHIRR